MVVPRPVIEHQRTQVQLAATAAAALARLWGRVDPDDIAGTWQLQQALAVIIAAQLAAARLADDYVSAMVPGVEAAGSVNPEALAGTASDGRSLETLLARPVITALAAIGSGRTVAQALASGLAVADMVARTQVADAGRTADQVAITARPGVAYTRVVSGGACDRCVVLAGREYSYSVGFARHPRCSCQTVPIRSGDQVGVPSPRELFDRMSREQQDRAFGRAAAEAIRDGADIAQVVNARRGMSAPGATTEGATRRGLFGRAQGVGRGQRAARITPQEIYRRARTRDEAVELLRQFGYLI